MPHKQVVAAQLKTGDQVGTFEGYASVFGNVDSYGDVVQRGAFAETLTEWEKRGTRIPVLYGHNSADPEFNIGYLVSATEDDHGLKVMAQLDMDSPKAAHVYRMLKDRRIGEMSFAYAVRDSEQKSDHNLLKSLELHEVSVVPIGANRATSIENVKGGQPADQKKADTMNVSLKDQRAAAHVKAQTIVDGTKNADLTDEQKAELSGLVDQVKAFDVQIAKSLSSQALVDAVAALGGEPAKPADDEGAKSARPLTKGFLAFTGSGAKSAAQQAATKMLGAEGVKGLVATGKVPFGVPMVTQSPLELDRVPTSLLDVLPVVTRDLPVWEYLRQTVRTNNAAPVAAGALKPTSIYTIDKVPGKLEVIAHLSEALDRYTLLDNATLEQFVQDEMLFGLRQAVEAQVLNGDGTGNNLRGILNTSGIVAQAFATDILTSTRKAITLLEASGRTPGVFVMSPLDWESLELARRSDGAFDLSHSGIDRAQQKLHGVRVVLSAVLPAKSALLLDLSAVNVDTDTHGLIIENDTTSDMFARNQKCILVEGRFGVSVTRPSGIVRIATAAA